MKNAELHFHIKKLAQDSILSTLVKQQELASKLHSTPHLIIEYSDTLSTVKYQPESGVIEVEIAITALDFISNAMLLKVFNLIIEGANFNSLLPEQLKAFQFDRISADCSSSKLNEQRKEAQNNQEYDEHEVWVCYKHSLFYKLPPKSEKDLLKVIKADLQSRKKLAANAKDTFSVMTSINFDVQYKDKLHHCSLNALTEKLGFANSYDENGCKLDDRKPTWNIWATPTVDLSDLFKGAHTNAALKAIIKSHLVKGAKITAFNSTRIKFVENTSFYRSYKLIRMFANLGDYHNPVLAIVDIHKSGEIVVLDERGIDITTTHFRAQNMVNRITTLHGELFCSNKHYAKSLLTFYNISIYHRAFS